jgi:RimJ/RimL family protein N-acetyltransferase
MNFTLRPWSITDADSLVKHANNFKIAKFMTDRFPHPYTIDNAKEFIAFANNDTPVHIFAIDINGQAVGGIGIHPQYDVYKKNAEIGYWLGESFWGKGIMPDAIMQMTGFAFENYDINRIFARPFGTNAASQKVLKKAGFKLEGKFEMTVCKNGEYLDELIYAIRR